MLVIVSTALDHVAQRLFAGLDSLFFLKVLQIINAFDFIYFFNRWVKFPVIILNSFFYPSQKQENKLRGLAILDHPLDLDNS